MLCIEGKSEERKYGVSKKKLQNLSECNTLFWFCLKKKISSFSYIRFSLLAIVKFQFNAISFYFSECLLKH